MKNKSNKNKKIKYMISATTIIVLLLAATIGTNPVLSKTSDSFNEEISFSIEKAELVQQSNVKNLNGDDILFEIGDGDDRLPSLTMDDEGRTILTWTQDVSPTESSMGIAYAEDPVDLSSWEAIWIITIYSFPHITYCDTAFIESADPYNYQGLLGTFIDRENEIIGYYTIDDITQDPTELFFNYFTTNNIDPSYAVIDDHNWYETLNPQHTIGPYYMYIHDIQYEYMIPSCPTIFQTQIYEETGHSITFFDGQSNLITAPASDPDMACIENRFHLTWQYHDQSTETDKIVWKKIVPISQADIEYTPYQQYIDDGMHPSIAADENKVITVYEDISSRSTSIKSAISEDDGDTWDYAMLGPGSHPDVEIVDGVIYLGYVDEANLYLITSEDNGQTWSEPEQINDIDGTVEAEENCIEIHKSGIAWVDNRGETLDICYQPLPVKEPIAKTLISPDPMSVLMMYTLEPMISKIYLGDLTDGHIITEIDTSTIQINGDITPISCDVISSHPGFSGEVLQLQFEIAPFIQSYMPLWDITQQQYTVSAIFTDETEFQVKGDVTITGHISGDANCDGKANVGDAVYLINYVFNDGPQPQIPCQGDANGDGDINVGDAVYLINYVFYSGPGPVNIC